MQEITIDSGSREELTDITGQVRRLVARTGTLNGTVNLWCMHTTAGLTINENADPDVKSDIVMALGRIIPDDLPYRHGEGNSPAHLKSSLIGSHLCIAVSEGELVLGTWQGIMFCEFDGPRKLRRVKIMIQAGD